MSAPLIAFVGCGEDLVRADLIESYREIVGGFDKSRTVSVVTLAGRTYDFHGSRSDFETRLKRALTGAHPQ